MHFFASAFTALSLALAGSVTAAPIQARGAVDARLSATDNSNPPVYNKRQLFNIGDFDIVAPPPPAPQVAAAATTEPAPVPYLILPVGFEKKRQIFNTGEVDFGAALGLASPPPPPAPVEPVVPYLILPPGGL